MSTLLDLVYRERRAHIWRRAHLDWYADSADCTAGLFRAEDFAGTIVDPCCGRGAIVREAREAGFDAWGSDVVQRGYGEWPGADEICDFFTDERPMENLVCNPPYDRLDEFIARAVRLAERKAAVLVLLRSLGSEERARTLLGLGLRSVLVIAPRPSMPPGEALKAGLVNASGGSQDFAWLVFERGYGGSPRFGWAFRKPQP